jgi:hypothetical protein
MHMQPFRDPADRSVDVKSHQRSALEQSYERHSPLMLQHRFTKGRFFRLIAAAIAAVEQSDAQGIKREHATQEMSHAAHDGVS